MADSEKVGIDWSSPLNSVKNSKYKMMIFVDSNFGFIDPNNVQIPSNKMGYILFETKGDNHIALYKNGSSVWGMSGKGEIRTVAISVGNMHEFNDYNGKGDVVNEDMTLNLSFDNIKNSAIFQTYDKLKKIYDNMQYDTLLSPGLLGYDVTMNIGSWYGRANKEIFNPDFHPVSDFENYIFGLTDEMWGGIGNIYNAYDKPYNVPISDLFVGANYFGPFKDNIPKSKNDILLDLLKSGSYLSQNQFYGRQERLVNLYGEDYTIDEFRRDYVTSYYDENFLKTVINSSNAFVYNDVDGWSKWYISGDNDFTVPDVKDLQWGYLNGINILVLSSDDTEDNTNQAKQYIDDPDNYTPPDNAQITTTDDNGTPTTATTTPDYTNPEDESKDKNDNKDSTTFPSTWDSTTGASLYEITHDELNSFIHYFWGNGITMDANILQLLQGLYGNISESVLGVTFLPVNLDIPKSQKSVKIGRLETSFTWQYITDNVVSKTLGSIEIKPQSKRKTFFDYAPYTEIKLYLPYLGIVDLDTNSYMDTNLTVKIIVDVASGNASYVLLSDGCLYDTFTFQLGISIPFTLSNGSQIQASYMQNAISCALTVATTPINPVSGVKTIGTELSALTDVTVPSYNNKGSISGASTLGNCQNCILYIKRPIYNRPSNYGRMVGYPVNKTFKLSALKGYTVCENAKIASFESKPTDTEYNEIVALLEKGVII